MASIPQVNMMASIILTPTSNVYETTYTENRDLYNKHFDQLKQAYNTMLTQNADWRRECAIYEEISDELAKLNPENRLLLSNELNKTISKMVKATKSAFTMLKDLTDAKGYLETKSDKDPQIQEWIKDLNLKCSSVKHLHQDMQFQLPITENQAKALQRLLVPSASINLFSRIVSLFPTWATTSSSSSSALIASPKTEEISQAAAPALPVVKETEAMQAQASSSESSIAPAKTTSTTVTKRKPAPPNTPPPSKAGGTPLAPIPQ